MRLTKRDMSLLLVLLGLVVFLGAYLGVSNRYNARTLELKEQIDQLEPRLQELRDHETKLPEYHAGIEQSIAHVEKELEKFPGDVRTEDLIMYAIALENDVGLEVSQVGFTPAQMVSQFEIVRENQQGETEYVPMAAMRIGLSATCEMSYSQLKSLCQYIYSTRHSTTLESLSVSYNAESGRLYGSADIGKYFVTSRDYTYTPTQLPRVERGTDDPFGTFEVKPADEGSTTTSDNRGTTTSDNRGTTTTGEGNMTISDGESPPAVSQTGGVPTA